MVDGVRHAGVLGNALVGEVYLAVGVHGNVLQQCVAADGVVDVGLGFLAQIDNLGVAAAFEIEHTFVVPAVFVVADEQTFGVGAEGCLARSRKAEENGGVLAFHVGVGRAVHGGNALERQQVVHYREQTFFHLAAVPGVEDYLLVGFEVENGGRFAVQTQFLEIGNLGF